MDYHCQYVDYNNPSQSRALVDLLNQYAEDPAGGGEPLPPNVKKGLINALKARPFAHSFLIYHNEQAIGFANCFEAFSSFACAPILNIHDFAVVKAYRGKGVAGELLHAIEAFATKKGMVKITLEVLSNNTSAKSAYSRFGFAAYTLEEAYGVAEFWQKKLTVEPQKEIPA